MSGEETIWVGRPSQWTNAGHFAGQALWCGIIGGVAAVTHAYVWFGLALPVFAVGKRALMTHSTRYELTSERVKRYVGVFSRNLDEVELYRVRDYRVAKPFLLRLVGRGHLRLHTADRSEPILHLVAIPRVEAVKDLMRGRVETRRSQTGVQDVEIG